MHRRLRQSTVGVVSVGLVLAALLASASAGSAQQRRGPMGRGAVRHSVALGFGYWDVTSEAPPAGVTQRDAPLYTLSFERGLRPHSAVETTIGLWRRVLETDARTGVFGGGSSQKISTYLVPLTVGAKLYPFTTAISPVEPFGLVGAGLVVGIDHSKPGTLEGSGGTNFVSGFGLRAGAGIQARLGRVFGLAVRGGYLWTHFGADVGVARTFRGFHADIQAIYHLGG